MRTNAKIRSSRVIASQLAAVCAVLILPLTSGAFSAPVSSEPAADVAESNPPSDSDPLEDLVAPVALYPDDLLAIVLPASTYPIQIVQASRFLADWESNPDLDPDPEWDESVYALLNYPEALAVLDDDLDWTWQLGEAVVEDQGAVMDAVQRFRHRVYAAGNLESNDKQVVAQEDEAIIIEPADPEVIYVPTYYPSQVVVVQPRWPLYWWSDPYPYYYSPLASFWTGFGSGFVWGLAWNGWRYPHHYYGHHHITVHKDVYVHTNGRGRHSSDRGDAWKPRDGKMQGGRPGRRGRGGETVAGEGGRRGRSGATSRTGGGSAERRDRADSRGRVGSSRRSRDTGVSSVGARSSGKTATQSASASARTSRSSTSGQAHWSRLRSATKRDSGSSRISPKSGGKSVSASTASSRASRVARTGGSSVQASRSRGSSAQSRVAASRGKSGSSSARWVRSSKSKSSGSSRAVVRSSGSSASRRARSVSTASPTRQSRAISSAGSSRRAVKSQGISRVRSSSGFKGSSGMGAPRGGGFGRGGGTRGGGGRRGGRRG